MAERSYVRVKPNQISLYSGYVGRAKEVPKTNYSHHVIFPYVDGEEVYEYSYYNENELEFITKEEYKKNEFNIF
jgi:hypothetical protein